MYIFIFHNNLSLSSVKKEKTHTSKIHSEFSFPISKAHQLHDRVTVKFGVHFPQTRSCLANFFLFLKEKNVSYWFPVSKQSNILTVKFSFFAFWKLTNDYWLCPCQANVFLQKDSTDVNESSRVVHEHRAYLNSVSSLDEGHPIQNTGFIDGVHREGLNSHSFLSFFLWWFVSQLCMTSWNYRRNYPTRAQCI